MDHAESRRRILDAMERRPLRWLAFKLGYGSTDYVSLMLSGREPTPEGFYDDVAEVLNVQPRYITPEHQLVTFARLTHRKGGRWARGRNDTKAI